MKRNIALMLLVLTAALCVVATGCSDRKEPTTPDNNMTQAGDDLKDTVENAGDAIMGGVENAGDAIMGNGTTGDAATGNATGSGTGNGTGNSTSGSAMTGNDTTASNSDTTSGGTIPEDNGVNGKVGVRSQQTTGVPYDQLLGNGTTSRTRR